jgi:hypothetical protein
MDASKNLTIVGGSDTYRPLMLGVEEIKSGSIELLESPIIVGLSSVVSHLWLPLSACKNFESAFGLVWNSTYELYIVNETQHKTLLAQNASVTLILSTGSEHNKTDQIDITFPYAAFDLVAKPPFAGLTENVRYFPLKQAANETQYTLGRTFLQEVYMIADYDRGALSLFPAVFPDSGTGTLLISIESPDSTGNNVDPKSGLAWPYSFCSWWLAPGSIFVAIDLKGPKRPLLKHVDLGRRQSLVETDTTQENSEAALSMTQGTSWVYRRPLKTVKAYRQTLPRARHRRRCYVIMVELTRVDKSRSMSYLEQRRGEVDKPLR